MNSTSTTDRPLSRAQHRVAIRARHRRAAISAAASAVVCGQRSSNCTLTTPKCHSKNNNRFHHRNQQYSVIALTNGIGVIAERYAYSAYGEPVFVSATGTLLTNSAKENRYTYTGREWDEDLNLYHFRARMYDAESGRFCGRDLDSIQGVTTSTYQFAATLALTLTIPEGRRVIRWVASQIQCDLLPDDSGLNVDYYPIDCFLECVYVCFKVTVYAYGDEKGPSKIYETRVWNLGALVPHTDLTIDVPIESCGSCEPDPPDGNDCPPSNNFPPSPWQRLDPPWEQT